MHRRLIYTTAAYLAITALLVVQLGCASSGAKLHPPLSADIRANLTNIAVVSAEFLPKTVLKGYAKGRAGGAARGVVVGVEIDCVFHPFPCLISTAAFPVAMVVGGVVGASVAESSTTIEEKEAAINMALSELKIQDSAKSALLEVARSRTSHSFIVVDNAGPERVGAVNRYRGLSGKDIDSVLELAVLRLGFAGEVFGINPPLEFFMELRARLINTRSNAAIYEHLYTFRSVPHKIAEWGEDDARLFSDELARAYGNIASRVIEDLFIRTE